MKSKIKSSLIYMAVITGIIVIFSFIASRANQRTQHIDCLDYDVTINEDGSVRIVETWEVYINYTNTLFRNFDYGSNRKYGDIIDVTVTELTENKEYKNSYKEQYHVTTGYYYALPISKTQFEIAWGTGMEHKSGYKKYQIAYTITDVISEYKDSQEFYWKLLSEENNIPVKRITGRINLPEKVNDIDNLKVWGHGVLKAEIHAVSKDRIEFVGENLKPNTMFEVRVAMLDKIVDVESIDRIMAYNLLPVAIREETEWAEETNYEIATDRINVVIIGVIYIVLMVYNIIKAVKAHQLLKTKKEITVMKLDYYKEIPRGDDSTPGEAAYLHYFDKTFNNFNLNKHQSNMVAGTILNLCLKKHISLRMVDKEVYIKILTDGENLKGDELNIFKLLKKCKDKDDEFEISKLKTYAKTHYNEYEIAIQKFVNSARNSLYDLKLVDKNKEADYNRAGFASIKSWFIKVILIILLSIFVIGKIPMMDHAYITAFGISYSKTIIGSILVFAPLILAILAKLNIQIKLRGKIAVLTEKGLEEQEQWKALVKYMKDFSNFEEKGVPELILWEKYLVYATALGIADEVIKQMKAKYPEVFVREYWEGDENRMLDHGVLAFATGYGLNIGTSFSSSIGSLVSAADKAYKTSIEESVARSASSGGGSGGGFSSGGRWRRWPAAEWVADNKSHQKL